MATTHIAFDTRSGQIFGAFHGLDDAKQAAHSLQKYAKQRHVKIEPAHIDVIAVPADTVDPRKKYKVDPERKTLIPVAADEAGASFGGGTYGKLY